MPDVVAEKLQDYCLEFCGWVYNNPKFRTGQGVCYDQSDFIEYLNENVFPNEKSKQVKNLGWINSENDLPNEYKNAPWFNF